MLPAGLKAIGSLALLQTAASSSGIAYSALRSRQCWNDGMVPLPSASWQPSDRDARIESAVSSMYAGAGLHGALCSDDVAFEDAAALCCGGAEVVEAFRAVRALKPEHVTAPQVCYSSSSAIVLLHQRYLGCIVVRSQLHVWLDDARVIRTIEERWNGKPLLGAAFPLHAIPAVRRINPLLSFLATTNLLA